MSGKFKKQLTTVDLTFIGLGSIFGSGWLFAASHVSTIAGPAGVFSWLIGGIAVFLLGLVFCELGAALPRAGGIISYPVFSHGPLLGCLIGSITVIAFTSLVAIEVVASRQYATAWFPSLTISGTGNPTLTGWLFQFFMLCIFFYINYSSVKTFAKFNNIVSVFKFIVPLLVIFVLYTFFQPHNLTQHGFAPFGISGVEMAVSAGGVIFAYLGLTPIISVASEVKNPQKTIPIAMILSVLSSATIYILLQLAFIGSIPTDLLTAGWQSISKELALPYRDIAILLGVSWLGYLVVADAITSPAGCGNIYMNATPRVVYAWAKSGTLFKIFKNIDNKSGIPRPALWLTFLLSIFWTLPFPSWEALINVVSAALILSYALAPITVASLRKSHPELNRPFKVFCLEIIGPLSFIVAALIVYWSGWSTISWLLGLQLVIFFVYIIFSKYVPTSKISIKQQLKSSSWLVGFYIIMILFSWAGSFGGKGYITHPLDTVVISIAALIIYYWGRAVALPKELISFTNDDEDDFEYH